MNKAVLVEGAVGKTIMSMTLPLLGGIYAMITFTLVDTYFVSRLGTKALAAISFTFPVSMVLVYFILGVSVGTASVVARAIGAGDLENARRFAAHGLLLSAVFIVLEIAVGLATIDPLFRFLGARGEVLRLIRGYMIVWYFAIAFFIVSMAANNIIRAAGDAKFPGTIMMVSALINLILDPVLIFGHFGFPALGIRGAAVATLIAFFISSAALLGKQMFHYRLITFEIPPLGRCLNSWRQILYIGLPSGLTNVIINLAMAFVMRLLASFGEAVVAGFGIAVRVEELALAVFHAMSGVIAPFVGQNWGVGDFGRVRQGLNFTTKFCVFGGLALAVALAFWGESAARVFDKDQGVIVVVSLYMSIVPVTYGARGITMMVTSSLNALGRPVPATVISAIRTFVLYIPLAHLLKPYFGIMGIFAAVFLANAFTGLGTSLWSKSYLNKLAPLSG